jgi:hypothetical protein
MHITATGVLGTILAGASDWAAATREFSSPTGGFCIVIFASVR